MDHKIRNNIKMNKRMTKVKMIAIKRKRASLQQEIHQIQFHQKIPQ